MAALRRIGGAAFRNGIQHDTAYEATLLFETGYELEDQAASESRSRVRAPNTRSKGRRVVAAPEGARSERLAALRLAHAAGLGVDAIPGAR